MAAKKVLQEQRSKKQDGAGKRRKRNFSTPERERDSQESEAEVEANPQMVDAETDKLAELVEAAALLEKENMEEPPRRSTRNNPPPPKSVKKGIKKKASKGKNEEVKIQEEHDEDDKNYKPEEKMREYDSDDEAHHGNAITAYVRFKNVWVHKHRKQNPNLKLIDEVRRRIRDEWQSLTSSQKEPYLKAAAEERKKRKSEGTLQRKPTGEKANRKKKLAEAKLKGKSNKKLKNPRRFQSFMSLPSVMTLFKYITPEQQSWLDEVGLGALKHLQISETPEAFNRFLYESFDTDGSLKAHGRTVDVTPEVVGWLLGVRCTGTTEFPEVDPEVLQEVAHRIGLVKDNTKVGEYLPWFKKNQELFNDEWKQRAVCLILGALGMPIGRQGVRSGLVKLVVDLEHLKEVNWAALWLDHFRTQNVKAQTGTTLRGNGCVLILVVII